MKNFSRACLAMLTIAAVVPATAFAQDAPSDGITISGSATVVSDYRFRGFSQSDEEAAIQGGFTVSHDSGFYVGTWGSSIGFAGGTELDAFVGFSTEVASGVTADIGVNGYFYPGDDGAETTIFEPYASLSGDLGPASLKVGAAWSPGGQNSLADYSAIYVYSDVGVGIPNTPITLVGHVGYSKSDSFLGGADGDVFDYKIGVDLNYKALTLGVAYINTDAPKIYAGDSYKEAFGADGAVVFSLGASF